MYTQTARDRDGATWAAILLLERKLNEVCQLNGRSKAIWLLQSKLKILFFPFPKEECERVVMPLTHSHSLTLSLSLSLLKTMIVSFEQGKTSARTHH